MNVGVRAVDRTKILTRSEIATVIADLHRKRRSINTRENSIIFRLATCCGLRVSEIVGLTLANVKVESGRPHIYVPAPIAKRNRPRKVPLWWDGAPWLRFRSGSESGLGTVNARAIRARGTLGSLRGRHYMEAYACRNRCEISARGGAEYTESCWYVNLACGGVRQVENDSYCDLSRGGLAASIVASELVV